MNIFTKLYNDLDSEGQKTSLINGFVIIKVMLYDFI